MFDACRCLSILVEAAASYRASYKTLVPSYFLNPLFFHQEVTTPDSVVIDFANKCNHTPNTVTAFCFPLPLALHRYIGGGALHGGCVQEEIMSAATLSSRSDLL